MSRLYQNLARLSISCLILVLGASAIKSQDLDHVLGEILVEMKAEFNVDDLIIDNQINAGKNIQIKARKLESPTHRLYRVNFNHNNTNENSFLKKIRMDHRVNKAQFNHLIEYRNIPNDPQFSNQWQYINTGISGGKLGADIDMDLAWDLTTGGLTANGDTIVVCVIDGGMDGAHTDFGDNLWVNYAEIPDNGIDDDLNGYIDDHDGWNTTLDFGNDDVFFGGSHGTPVAGIIGAKGNNGIGVSGVNWDVKLMIVKGGGNEAEAIEAYNYPYIMRKRYNESNGAEGAFVVATNASWGTDLLDWQDAPIWCSFYDSLGTVGILNCGATANSNYNIDEQGDMPTSCPSDYLISVTNMNRNDNKVSNAGYGLESIDLGAFGESTWTAKLNNTYGAFGGTSGATPHVAGAIALAYSMDCPLLADMALSNPAQAVLLIREVILSGVDLNQSLEGITVTGGRLNVNNTLVILEGICGDCSFPFGVDFDEPGGDQVNLSWEMETDSSLYDLIFREKWTDNWDTLFNVQSPVQIENLEFCTEYELRLKTNCIDDSGNYSFSYYFSTDGCCIIPASHVVVEVQNGWEITLQDILATDTYTLQYQKFGDSDWIEETVIGNVFTIPAIDSCMFYNFRYKSICSVTETDFSSEYQLGYGCEACEENDFCQLALSNFFEYIDTFQIGAFTNISGLDPNAYGKYDLGRSVELLAGQSYDVVVHPGFENSNYDEYIRVFIDLDQSETFEQNEEMIYLFSQGGVKVTGSIEIPLDINSGYAKMRVIMAFKNFNSPCDQNLTYGEVEDYCVYLNSDISDCLLGNYFVDTLEVGHDFATIGWNDQSGTINYQYRYRLVQTTDWITGETMDTTISVSEIDSCGLYEFQLGAACIDGVVDYTNTVEFYTDCYTSVSEMNFRGFEVRAFPNPFSDKINLKFNGDYSFEEEFTLTIFDPLGKVILEQKDIRPDPSNNMITIDLAKVKLNGAGLMLIKLTGVNGIRLVKAFYLN